MQKIFKKILFLKDKYQSNIVFDTRLLSQNDIFIGIGNDFKNGKKHVTNLSGAVTLCVEGALVSLNGTGNTSVHFLIKGESLRCFAVLIGPKSKEVIAKGFKIIVLLRIDQT